MCPGSVIHHAEDDNGTQHQDTIIHVHSGGDFGSWPEAEKESDDHVSNSTYVHSDAGPPGYLPRAPCDVDFATALLLLERVGGRADSTSAAAPKQQDRADKVGKVEGPHCKRDDTVEGIGRADVDESKKARYRGIEGY